MVIKLKLMDMEISTDFLVHLIMSSLSSKFAPFTINFYMDVKWSIDEIMAMCVQKEERLKVNRIDYVNQFKYS